MNSLLEFKDMKVKSVNSNLKVSKCKIVFSKHKETKKSSD